MEEAKKIKSIENLTSISIGIISVPLFASTTFLMIWTGFGLLLFVAYVLALLFMLSLWLKPSFYKHIAFAFIGCISALLYLGKDGLNVVPSGFILYFSGIGLCLGYLAGWVGDKCWGYNRKGKLVIVLAFLALTVLVLNKLVSGNLFGDY